MHLAQLNIGEPKYALDDPRMADFMNNLTFINGTAERMDGFVWMHRDDTGHAMHVPTPWPNMVSNLTVWQDATSLENFVWNTVHKQFYNRKHEWFETMRSNHFVMWYIEEGHLPTLIEAKERLDHLDQHGNSDYAFTWSHLPHVKLWQTQQCG